MSSMISSPTHSSSVWNESDASNQTSSRSRQSSDSISISFEESEENSKYVQMSLESLEDEQKSTSERVNWSLLSVSTPSAVGSEVSDDESISMDKSSENSHIVVDEAPSWPNGISKNGMQDVGQTLSLRLLHVGPIFAILIMLIIAIPTYVLLFLWWPITSFSGWVNLLLFVTWHFLVFVNFLEAAYVGGGYVPLGWIPPHSDDQARLQYCHRCNGFKAPRSHHCVKCKRCVMKMDHHCPWINNCVGHRNQILFIRFLFFAVVNCAHSSVFFLMFIWRSYSTGYLNTSSGESFLAVRLFIDLICMVEFALSLSLAVAVTVSYLFYIQFKVALSNKTSVEHYICQKAAYRAVDASSSFFYPYDLGWKRNLREVFSDGSAFPKGDGIWWPVRHDCDQFTLTEEQLKQKQLKQKHAYVAVGDASSSWFSRMYRHHIQPIYEIFV